ncbi:MAG TPA: hypothetical protein VFS15_05625 [Kofleriaceae bacterium]|nr:hypothetical protein [Kofleriaceae bacterium]
MRLPLPIATYRLPSPSASSARLVNVYAEQAPVGAKGPVILRRAPGIRSWAEVGDGPIRGMTVMGGVLYVLSGEEFYSIASNGTATQITGTVPGAERVRIANNGTDIVIVRPDDNTAFESDGSTVTQITDPVYADWGATDVDYLDGYLVFSRPDSHQFFNTGLNEVTFSALDITSADGKPDNLLGLVVDHREIFLPGTESCELWYNAANQTGSPFSRSPNGLIELGCAAGDSLAKQDNGVAWLANDLTFRRLNGTTPERISQHGIEAAVQRFSKVDDCFALPYTQEGHLFVAFTFPFEGRTLVVDFTTGEWHERESLGYSRWRPNCIVQAYGKQIVGDSETGKLGILDPDTHEEWGEPQRVEWTYQPVYAERRRVLHQRLELVLNTGHGVTTGQGQNPLATLKVSDDGGETWRALPTRSLGEIGKYKTRAQWWRLGSARERVYRVEVTDPVPLYVTDTQLDAVGARS